MVELETQRGPDAGAMPSAGRMRALIQDRYGPPSILEPTVVDIPVPGRGEVLVKVQAASVHPGDVFIMSGRPRIVRLAFGLRKPRRPTPGMDAAGVIAAVGQDVTSLRIGDRVFGRTTTGSVAEYARARETDLAPLPDRLSAAQAAAVPTSAMTALQALRDIAKLQRGQTVLVTGASGGVGSFAVQLAAAMGADVIGVCSGRNVELVRSLGAHRVVDYETTDLAGVGTQFDVILDNVEAQPLAAMRRILAPNGTLIPNSGNGGPWIGPLGRILAARVRSAFTRQRLKPFTSRGNRDDLLALAAMLASGQVTPVIDRAFTLADAADALRQVATGHTRGKIVVAL